MSADRATWTGPTAFAIAAAALLTAAAWPGPSLSHDAAMYLHCGQLLLRGARPYVDYVELNPPLTHYVHVVPVWIAQRLGADVGRTFHALVGACAVGSALGVARLWPRRSRWTAATAWVALSALLLRIDEFGQREHLFVLAAVPWLLLRAARGWTARHVARAEQRRRGPHVACGAAIGAAAATAAMLKPHFVLLLLVVEGLLVGVRLKRAGVRAALRPLLAVEVLAALACGAAYAGHFLLWPAECGAAFFGRWVPLIARHYRVYDTPWAEVVWTGIAGLPAAPLWIAGAAGAALLLAWSPARTLRRSAEVLAVAAWVALGLYFAQHKGWTYHLVPALSLSAVALVGAIQERRASAGRGWRVHDATACTALTVAVLALTWTAVRDAPQRRDGYDRFAALIREHARPGESVAFISTSVNPAYPSLLYAGRDSGTRYPCAFPIAMFYDGVTVGAGEGFPYRVGADQGDEERVFLAELAADIATRRPALVFIQAEESFQACPPGFRIDEYLERTGWTRAALARYERIYGQFGGYAVHRRSPGG